MNITKWNELYENNKRLDKIFIDKYQSDTKLFEKNCIELLVEISEFVNETKVFKYWSVKTPNKDKMLEEYADVITMILTFSELKNMKIKEKYKSYDMNLLDIIHELYSYSVKLRDDFNELIIEEIFSLVLDFGKKLNFSENDIIEAIKNKQKIIENRLNSDY